MSVLTGGLYSVCVLAIQWYANEFQLNESKWKEFRVSPNVNMFSPQL